MINSLSDNRACLQWLSANKSLQYNLLIVFISTINIIVQYTSYLLKEQSALYNYALTYCC